MREVEIGENGVKKIILLPKELAEHFVCDEKIAFAFGGGGIAVYDTLYGLAVRGEKEIKFGVVGGDVFWVFYQFL